MDSHDAYLAALIELHTGLDRQGPGDEEFARTVLATLPELPAHPRIVDLGCGAGAGALLLARHFDSGVTAVDFARPFLDTLEANARAQGLDHLVTTVEADFGNLDLPEGSIDLLWSEGAAYVLSFEGALRIWRPLMAPDGVAVISEICWFADEVPESARRYWEDAYPSMATEAVNVQRAEAAGFEVLGVYRLPSEAWWSGYYGPLREHVEQMRLNADEMMRTVIAETDAEMEFFERYSDFYGYSFYVLRAAR